MLSSLPFSDQSKVLNFKHVTCAALTFRVSWEQNRRILRQGPKHRGQEPGGVLMPLRLDFDRQARDTLTSCSPNLSPRNGAISMSLVFLHVC